MLIAVRHAGGGEIICVDDGSTDAPPKIVDEFAESAKESGVHIIVIHKSWNEWAEGNYLEPGLRCGHQYLQAVKDAVVIE